MILVGLAAYVALPLYANPGPMADAARRARLEARRDALSQTLRDIEQDHQTQMIGSHAYEMQRSEAAAELGSVLRELGEHSD